MYVEDFDVRKILNSRKEETIAVRIKTKDGTFETSAPSGKSRGKNEVFPFSSKGVETSLQFARAICFKIVKERISFETFQDLEKIEEIIKRLDNTTRFELVGGNVVYTIEASILKAIAASQKKELWEFLLEENKPKLPFPIGNCIGGGKHTNEKPKPDFQEFLVIPILQFNEAYFVNLQAYKEAKRLLLEKDKFFCGKTNDERAFVTSLANEKVLELMLEIKKRISEKFGRNIEIGVDVAATFLYEKKYNYSTSVFLNKKNLSEEEQINYICDLVEKYDLFYVEDPLHEEDFDGFSELMKKIKKISRKTLIVADDLVCTNYHRLEKAIKKKSINALILKPNQRGSLLEMKKTLDLAKKNGIVTIISHRSGETYDSTIAHLAVGWQIPFIKAGILGKERFAKLHELLRIERKIFSSREKIY
ncbi:MAG: phosphopyruvate hydratase [Candidatus Pacearchaeota archaeon]|nr:phosphopyruvate hydratase [Candidatus Pacearchaeota archaeon]